MGLVVMASWREFIHPAMSFKRIGRQLILLSTGPSHVKVQYSGNCVDTPTDLWEEIDENTHIIS